MSGHTLPRDVARSPTVRALALVTLHSDQAYGLYLQAAAEATPDHLHALVDVAARALEAAGVDPRAMLQDVLTTAEAAHLEAGPPARQAAEDVDEPEDVVSLGTAATAAEAAARYLTDQAATNVRATAPRTG